MANKKLQSTATFDEHSALCRLCTKNHKEYFNIFVSNAGSHLAFYNVIQDLLNLEVSVGDGLPDTVCHQCLKKLMEFSEFKEMCVKSAAELKNNTLESSLKVDIKDESIQSESQMEEGLYRDDHVGQIISQERAENYVVCVPLQIGDQMNTEARKTAGVDSVSSAGSSKMQVRENCWGSRQLPVESVGKMLEVHIKEEPEDMSSGDPEDYSTIREQDSLTHDLEQIVVKEEATSNEFSAEELCEDENIGEDESQERASYNVICVPLEMENQINVKEEPIPSESLTKESCEGENLVDEKSHRSLESNVVCVSLEMGNQIGVKEEPVSSESFAEVYYEFMNCDNEKPRARPECNIACVPLEVGNQVDNSSFTRSSQKTSKLMSRNLGIEIPRNQPVAITRKQGCDFYPPGPSQEKEPEFNRQMECMSAVRGGTLETKNYMVGTSTICCTKATEERNELLESQNNYPCNWTEYVCNYCGYKCTDKHELLMHIPLHIPKERTVICKRSKKPFKCETCGKRFVFKNSLVRHFLVHTGEKPYKCETCGRRFNQKSSLLKHMGIHSDSKAFKCEECGKGFNQKGDLLRHSLVHMGMKPYKCDTCEKGFSKKSDLLRHSAVHTNLKPFRCDSCGKEFSFRSALLRHAVIHTGSKPHKCEICGKGFNQRCVLVRHLVVHTGSRPFRCETCGKGFTRKDSLLTHSLSHSGSEVNKQSG